MERIDFLGLQCVRLANDSLELLVARSAGPRIISLKLTQGQNLFAELPNFEIPCPDSGVLKLWGGHRLWYAPEVPALTYLPDHAPVTISKLKHGLKVTQPIEAKSGIEKSMQITLPDQTAKVIVDHTLRNTGLWAVELAPWAITQIKPGGIAILPQNTAPSGVLPNRRLTLWPYTDMKSPYIQWGNRYIFVQANLPEGDSLKVGFPNPHNWLGYWLDQTLFVKQATYQAEADYFDFGSSTEFYARPEFVELETLGPRTMLAPGESVTHRETWRLYPNVKLEPNEDAVQKLVKELGIE